MRPARSWNAAIGAALLASCACWGAAWQAKDGEIAQAVRVAASDGAPASLEVRCRPEPEVTLTHPALAAMPADEAGRLDWYRGALVYDGWGLDLTRPDHFGHLGVWIRCAHRSDCVRPRRSDTARILERLRKEWSWFIRIQPPDAEAVDLRVPLGGSARAIDAVCGPAGAAERDRKPGPASPTVSFPGAAGGKL